MILIKAYMLYVDKCRVV